MVTCTPVFPATNGNGVFTVNSVGPILSSGSVPLKSSTVAFLDSLSINNALDAICPGPCVNDCYILKTSGTGGFTGATGYYTTGNCIVSVISAGNNSTNCPGAVSTCSPSLTGIDLALAVDNIFALVDYSLDPIIKGILNTGFTALGSLATTQAGIAGITTAGTLGSVIGTLANYPNNAAIAAVNTTPGAPLIKSMVVEDDHSHLSNNSVSVDMNTLKALFGLHA